MKASQDFSCLESPTKISCKSSGPGRKAKRNTLSVSQQAKWNSQHSMLRMVKHHDVVKDGGGCGRMSVSAARVFGGELPRTSKSGSADYVQIDDMTWTLSYVSICNPLYSNFAHQKVICSRVSQQKPGQQPVAHRNKSGVVHRDKLPTCKDTARSKQCQARTG